MNYAEFIARKRKTVKPMGFDVNPDALNSHLFDWQRRIVHWALRRGRAAIFADTGLGKALKNGTGVLTPDGFLPIESLQIGDLVYGQNGKTHAVLGVYPQGKRELYRVTFSDGFSIECDGSHLWNVRSKKKWNGSYRWKTITTIQILESGLRGKASTKQPDGPRRWFVPMPEPIEFGERGDLPIEPYTLGALLGDGTLKHTPSICTDDEIVSRLTLPDFVKAESVSGGGDYWGTSYLSANLGGHWNYNPLTMHLREMGLHGLGSHEKFVPTEYLFSSIENRKLLLSGLIDTDGYPHPRTIEYSTSSPRLADDVIFLARSLGYLVRRTIREQPRYQHNGESRIGKPSHRIYIDTIDNPFILDRKRSKFAGRKSVTRAIESIEPCGEGEATCIMVDSPDHLFICDGFVVTHNTLMELSWAEQVVKKTDLPVILHCPLGVRLQTKREAEKFAIDCDVQLANEQSEVVRGINLVNYDKLDHFDPTTFGGVVLGESSILKNLQGKTKRRLCEAYSQTPYRLAETATPAPNDHDELGSHSEFLGVSEAVDMRNRFFYHDSGDTGKWTLMPHARKDFWRWVAEWAICIAKPSDIGGDDTGYVLPPLNIEWHCVEIPDDVKPEGFLFNVSGISATSMHDEKRMSNEYRAARTAEIVASDEQNQWVIWSDTNYEADAIKKLIPEAVEIRGTDKESVKEQKLLDFATGKIRVFLTKPSITSHGLNWQNCHNTVFAGRSFSFEKFYQSVRRFYRFGQEKIVNVHVVYAAGEDAINQAIARKQADFEVMRSGMAEAMNAATLEQLGLDSGKKEYKPTVQFQLPKFLEGASHVVS